MRIRFIYIILFACFSFATLPTHSMVTPSSSLPILPSQTLCEKIMSLKVKDVQHLIGRTLSIKERIAFLLMKEKIKHLSKKGKLDDAMIRNILLQATHPAAPGKREDTGGQGQTAFIISLIGLGMLVGGLFLGPLLIGSLIASIVAIAMGSSAYKKNSSDLKAHSAKLIGWITLGLLIFLAILIAAIISSWAWGWG